MYNYIFARLYMSSYSHHFRFFADMNERMKTQVVGMHLDGIAITFIFFLFTIPFYFTLNKNGKKA